MADTHSEKQTTTPSHTDSDPLVNADGATIFSGAPAFSLRHRALRAVFGLVWAITASWTPPPMHRWRRGILRLFGAQIATGARVYSSARIWYPPNLVLGPAAIIGPRVNCYNQAPITIEAHAIVSQGAHLCSGTHDIADPGFQLLTRPITIHSNAWVCADAFVGPGVTIMEGAVLGARGVAMRDLKAWSVYSGNPAVLRKERPRFERGVHSG